MPDAQGSNEHKIDARLVERIERFEMRWTLQADFTAEK